MPSSPPPIEVLFEDDQLLVINKAPGQTLQGAQQSLCQQLGLLPVHRLDKPTSGVCVLAKTAAAARELSPQFESRQVEKLYLALSDKKPKKKQGAVAGDMEKARRGAWKLLRSAHNPARTRFYSYGLGDGRRLFVLKPYTGKTHQLRVALKSLGAPILGDELYGGSQAARCFLHAWQLSLHYRGKRHTFVAPPDGYWPAEFIASLEVAALSWPP